MSETFVNKRVKHLGFNLWQVGLVTFSSAVHNRFYLDAHSSQSEVETAVGQVPYTPGNTHTGEAIRFVRRNTLSANHGHRVDAQPIVIVLTDGQSQNKSVEVLVVDIGFYANFYLLISI